MSAPSFKFFVDATMVPEGFLYPPDYLEFVNCGDYPDLSPWSFLWEKELDSLVIGLKERYPGRSLVPFARRVDCDDVACFDGADTPGGSIAHIIHDFASPGWEQRSRFSSFSAWLKSALVDAQEWAADE